MPGRAIAAERGLLSLDERQVYFIPFDRHSEAGGVVVIEGLDVVLRLIATDLDLVEECIRDGVGIRDAHCHADFVILACADTPELLYQRIPRDSYGRKVAPLYRVAV
jgi:hypothetical protein